MKRTAMTLLVLGIGCGPQSGPGDGDGDGGGTQTASAGESSAGSVTESTTTQAPGSSTVADSSTSTTTGGGSVEACVCELPSEEDVRRECGFDVVCDLPTPCPRLTVTCPRPGRDLYDCGPEFVYDTDAMRCVLEVLRDDTPAHLLVDGDVDWGIYTGQEERELIVLGDGRVTTTSCMATDVGAASSASVTQSAGAEHFAGCLELDVPRDRYECLWAGLTRIDDVPACP